MLFHHFLRIVHYQKIRVPYIFYDFIKFVLVPFFIIILNETIDVRLINSILNNNWSTRLIEKLKAFMLYIFAFSSYF
jgi:hypothetical protein